MQVLINVPDNLPQSLVQKRISQLEERLKKEAQKITEKPSKWALLAEKVNNNPVHLDGYSEQLKKDIKEFRNNAEF